jgi:hypothetical protein
MGEWFYGILLKDCENAIELFEDARGELAGYMYWFIMQLESA